MPKEIEVKSVLNKTKRRDSWFLDDYTFNPYSSCGFNCLYCYIRGSKYGSNLEESLSVKVNAIELLDKQLSRRAKKDQYGFIVVSSATDPYQKIEKEYKITRSALEVILKYKFPVHIITKSDMVVRDYDLLKSIDQQARLPKGLETLGRGSIITFSFSSLDNTIGKIFEPGATLPSARLVALQKTLQEGFLSGVSLMPLLPYISDTKENLDLMFNKFRDLGTHYVMPATITLFGHDKADSKVLMLNVIAKHFPELLAKYQRFFHNNHEMPQYYRNAFYKKMKELSNQYQIPDRIFLI